MTRKDTTYQNQVTNLDTKQVQDLLDRYMAGLTTPAEEQCLAGWFRTHDVPDEWFPYREMFAWLDAGMPRTEGILYSDTPASASLQTDRAVAHPKARIISLRRWLAGVASAAAVAALVWMVWPRQETVGSGPSSYVARLDSVGKAVPASSVTADSTVEKRAVKADSASEKKTNRFREYRKFRRAIVSPEIYLAEEGTVSRQKKQNHQLQVQADSIILAAQREIDYELFKQQLYTDALVNRVDSEVTQMEIAFEDVLRDDADQDRLW